MPLETATYISDLVTSNPAASDGMNNADDHMRLIKSVLKNTFPAVVNVATRGPLDGATHGFLADQGSPATPGFAYSAKPTLGFYAIDFANNVHGFTGTLRGTFDGAIPAGSIMDFGGSAAPSGWLVCDGQGLSTTTYAALFTAIGYTWGGSGATFNAPNLISRFRRHRDGNASLASAVGTLKGPANLSHDHGVNGNTGPADADHTHGVNINTGNDSPDHTHGFTAVLVHAPNVLSYGGGPNNGTGAAAAGTTTGANQRHAHNVSGNTGGISANHGHGINFTSGASGDANESRPYSATVLTCIKV